MNNFIGRKQELTQLEKAYASDKMELAVIYGRRRIGKTELINQFCIGKKAIQFTATLGGKETLLEYLSQDISRILLPDSPLRFNSFEEAITFVSSQAKQDRLVFVIDEFPYLAGTIPEAMSLIQILYDRQKRTNKLMLILSGSSLGFMEHQVLGQESPLYGRKTCLIHLFPFEFAETCQMLGTMSLEDKATVHAITGGIPQYISEFNDTEPLAKQIADLFFQRSGLLFNEPVTLLLMEVRNPNTYMQVCKLLAEGANKVSELSDKAHMNTATISAALDSLQELGIVQKEFPVGKSIRKPIWTFKDNLYAFWFRFVYPFISQIESGYSLGTKQNLEQNLPIYLGHCFEQLSQHYLLLHSTTPIKSIGRWWGSNTQTKREEEIDIVAQTFNTLWIFGECKWTHVPVGIPELDTLKMRSVLVTDSQEKEFWLFSKQGFSQNLIILAANSSNIRLVSLEDMG